MGINEKRYPFMDEGWTTAFEYLRNRYALGAPAVDSLFKDFRIAGWAWSGCWESNPRELRLNSGRCKPVIDLRRMSPVTLGDAVHRLP